MALSEKDLKSLVEEVSQAKAILAQKAKHEQEIAQAEKRLGRLRDEYAQTEAEHIKLRNTMADSQSRYEHEKRRYEADLGRVVGECAAKKVDAERALSDAKSVMEQDMAAHRARMGAERARLDKEVKDLRDERDALLAINRQAKSRLQSLEG
jgi:hypothetical protein